MAADDNDDAEPPCVSQMLQWKLQENRLSFLEQCLKHSYVNTYRRLGYLNDDMLCHVGEGLPVGTVSRFRHLRNEAWNEAAAVEELLFHNIDFTDAEPECISRKLAAKLKGHSIECLSGVLASCDILSFEWLGRLSREEIEVVCGFAYAKGIAVEATDALSALCVEAAYEATTRRTQAFEGSRRAAGRRGDGGYGAPPRLLQNVAAPRGTGPPPLVGAHGTRPPPLVAVGRRARGDQAPQTFHWQRFLLSSIAKLELERALMWSTHPKLNWAHTSATLKRAGRDLRCQARDLVDAPRQRRDLRGALRAFSIICELAKAAKRDGWSTSGCASAIRSTAPRCATWQCGGRATLSASRTAKRT